jgi:tRNA(Arg) A34 adenosine deaminase TadA
VASKWSDLAFPWQTALAEAWEAYSCGSLPIGAVVAGPQGEILAKGRNHIKDDLSPHGQIGRNQLSHAELNVLLQISDVPKDVIHTATLYTTLEPCPLCIGAFYMSGVRTLVFAARDVYGGASDVIGKTDYYSRKPVKVLPPPDPTLEAFSTAITCCAYLQCFSQRPDIVVETQRNVYPKAVEIAEEWDASGWLNDQAERKQDISLVFSDFVDRFSR